MGVSFAAGLVNGLERRARKLELASRFQADGALSGRLDQSDDAALVQDRVPAEFLLHALQNRPYAPFAAIGHGRVTVDREGKLLVFRADAPLLARLATGSEVVDKLCDPFDRPGIGRIARHMPSFGAFSAGATLAAASGRGGLMDDSRPRDQAKFAEPTVKEP
jgi:hypothetical protein